MNANDRDAGCLEGKRRAYIDMRHACMRGLGYDGRSAKLATLLTEREEAIAKLREVCGEHGDNDWDEKLHLADIIDKHLGRHLDRDRKP